MIWVLAVLMAVVVGAALSAPFLRRRSGGAVGSAEYDRQVYRTQLAEVDRDLARGVVGAEDAARLKIEVGRKLLEADRLARSAPQASLANHRGMALLALPVVAGAVGLYVILGAPGMPDEPIAVRKARAEAVYASRPTQAEAEAAASAPRMPAAPPDADYVRLVEQLRAAVAQRPDDPQGLALLAEHEARLGNIVPALEAQRRLMALRGEGASAEDHTRLAALMVEAAGGLITPEAEAEIAKALQKDPASGQARYIQGLLMLQNQRPDRAFAIWRSVLEQDPGAPWAGPIRAAIGDLAWFAGEPGYEPPPLPTEGSPASPGPDAAAVAAAADMTPAERAAMVEQMVARLEERLATEGGTPEEWARLIGALSVQGKRDHANRILAEARRVFDGQPEAMTEINAAAARSDLE